MAFVLLLVLAAYIGAVGLLAAPIALACIHWTVRLAMLFAASALLGSVPLIFSVRFDATMAILLGVLLIAGSLATSLSLLRVLMAGAGIHLLVVTIANTSWDNVPGDWIVRGFITLGLLSASMLPVRVLGYRLVVLSHEGCTDDFIAGTGRDLDQWCAWLEDRSATLHFRGQVVRALREEGLEATWAEAVADAYARYRGMIPIAADSSGAGVFAVPAQRGRSYWCCGGSRASVRFSVAQLMVWMTVIAAVLGFIRLFVDGFPTHGDVVYGPPLILILGISTFASAIAALSMPRNRRASLCCLAVVIAGAIAVPRLLYVQASLAGAVWVASVVTMIAASVMFAGFTLLRHRGYRLLRTRLVPVAASTSAG